jgi:dolichol-phosphate mannosyltransferase
LSDFTFMKKIIVVPTYNERDNIVGLMATVFGVVPDSYVLVVDDGSPDGTAELVEQFQKNEARVFLLKRTAKNGLGAAYVAGFKWALERGYEFISEMDADWSHPPRYLKEMHRLSETNDFVIGSRYVKGGGSVNWSFFRKLISRFGSLYSRLILGVAINDFTGGFNGWHARVLNLINLDTMMSDGYSFQIELKYRAARLGFKFSEFPIMFEERREGESKMSAAIVREAIWKVWSIRFHAKSRAASEELVASASSNSLDKS